MSELTQDDIAFKITAKGAILYVKAIIEQKREDEFIEKCTKNSKYMYSSVDFINFVRDFILTPPVDSSAEAVANKPKKRRTKSTRTVALAARLPPLDSCT